MKLGINLASSSWRLLAVAVGLSVIGLIFVFEASGAESYNIFGEPYHFVKLQSLRLVMGLVGLIVVRFVPIKLWQKTSSLLYLLGVGLLLLVFVPGLGSELNGARRWLMLGALQFQPVELTKFAIIIFFSAWMSKHQRLLPFLFLTGLPAGLLLLQPDFGSMLVVISIAFGVYYMAGGSLGKILLLAMSTGLVLALMVIASPYRLERLNTFLSPESDPLGSSFHIRQITIALGRGSWFGQGIGQSKQKYSYIPEASSDSIFAIVAEEIGFAGSLVLATIFFYYLHLGLKIAATNKPGTFPYLLASGVVIWIAAQTLLNLAAVVALVPLTGIPLPFFSYGGTSLITILIATGLLLACEKKSKP